MAKPVTASAAKLIVLLGNGATPTEAFAAPCGLTTKGINFAADTGDIVVPDCDDPDLPSWVERVVRSLSGTISGSGVLALESFDEWRGYFFGGVAKNVRVKFDVPLAQNGGYFQGSYVLTRFNVTGEIGNKIRLESVEMQSDGEVSWVPAAA